MKTEIFILSAIIWAATARAQITPEQAQRMRTEAETEYFDIRSVRSAYDDFRRNPDYDAERYAEKLRELESLCASDADADKERIIELKRELGFTMLMVTHNANIAATADTVINMNSGAITDISANASPASAFEIGW